MGRSGVQGKLQSVFPPASSYAQCSAAGYQSITLSISQWHLLKQK